MANTLKVEFENKKYELEYQIECLRNFDAYLVLSGDTDLKDIAGPYMQFLRPQNLTGMVGWGYKNLVSHNRERQLKEAIAAQIWRV